MDAEQTIAVRQTVLIATVIAITHMEVLRPCNSIP